MQETIDPETQREWELITATSTVTETMAELFTFLEPRWPALKRIHYTQVMKDGTCYFTVVSPNRKQDQ